MRKLAIVLAPLLVVALVIGVISVTVWNEEEEEPTPTLTPTDVKTFSKYGFSFEYPRDFPVTETVLEIEASNGSGIVAVGRENEEVEYFVVTWIHTVAFILEDVLEGPFALMESDERIESVERGELVEATKARHRMLYQYYTATSTEGDEWYGIAAAFYCDNTQRSFGLRTINSTISAEQDVLEDFMNYLDSFVCH